MGVGVDFAIGVGVAMRVDQAGALEEGDVMENVKRAAFGDEAAALKERAAVGDFFEAVEIMGGDDDGLGATAPGDQEIDDLAFAARIEGGGGFVEEKNFGVENHNGGDGDALLFAAGEAVRGAVAQVGDVEGGKCGFNSFADARFGPAELQGTEGEFVEDGGIEELDVGILEDQADAAAEGIGEARILEA